MVLPRPTALRSLAPARMVRSAARPATRSQWQPIAKRGYASGESHGHGSKPSSDLPWLISGIAVTVPSCWFLWPEGGHEDHHASGGEHAHGEDEDHASDEHEEEQPSEDEPKEEGEASEQSGEAGKDEESKDEESKDDKSKDGEESESGDSKDDESEDGGDKKPTGITTESGKGNKTEGVQFKGKTSAGDDDNEMPDTRKREPDSKGAFKKRVDSGYQKNLGEGPTKTDDGRSSAASASAPSGDKGAVDTKQQGLSNTPTRHSTQIDQDPEKSKKGEGNPETAKSMGTVDPNRPQK